MRRQQIAFHTLGKKLQGVLPRLSASHALLLCVQAVRDPRGQRMALDRINLHTDAVVLQRAEPSRAFGGFIKTWQQHHRERAVVTDCQIGNLLQGGAAFLTRLARRNADFNQLLVGKQTHGATGCQDLAPVKVRPRHGVDAALGVALRAGCGAQSI